MSKESAERMRNVQATVDDLKICQHNPPNVVTQVYGCMKFDENEIDPNTRLPQYIRLSLNTNAETVVRFMRQGWLLHPPDLIISVTGGAKNFEMSTRLKKIFQRGLVAAAITTNAWLITAGTNAGVVKEVGEALNNYRYKNRQHGLDVSCIGIASWGYTAGNEQLDNQSVSVSANTNGIRSFAKSNQSHTVQALRMELGDQYCVRSYTVKNRPEKRCELEPNHTHFLLFDDGQFKADNVLQLRAEIEKCSRQVNGEVQGEGAVETLIPIVMVLVEGGPSSIRTICQALDINTPVVVVKDSGRAADLVAELYACYVDSDVSGHPPRPQTGLSKSGPRENEINAIFTKVRNQNNAWVDEVKTDLCRVLQERKQLVTIFKFDSKRHNGNLEDAILEALLNAAKFSGDHNENYRRTAELKLAMAWHKFDYAQNHILTDTTISKWAADDLRRALVDALRRGHVDFVELLIEFGAPLEKLTLKDLEYLYSAGFTADLLPLKHGRKHDKRKRKRSDYYSDYFGTLDGNQNKISEINDENLLGKNAPRELFFWAVFLNRFELATYLCSKTWNSSIAPLFAARIYRRASRLVLNSDTKQQYEDNADQFDLHSMSIIDRCFDNDKNFAVDLLKVPATAFYDVNPLALAQRANCRSFLASKCVQRYLDNKWFGHIDYKRKAINFRIFLCSLFLPLFPIFCFFLPYVEKRKETVRSARDRSKISQPIMIHTVVGSDQQADEDRVRFVDKLGYFYRAPIVRFYYYTIFFVTFLFLFSFILLVDYFPLNNFGGRRSGYLGLQIPITEIILHICLWSLIIEELRQVIFSESKREYISEVWNMIDVLAIVLYLVGFITRFFILESLFIISKIFLCLDLLLWYVRTLHLFAAFEKLGPKLVMIFNTLKDLLFFVCFILIFLMGFSITSWSLITTTSQVNWTSNDDGTTNVTIQNGGSGLWTWQLLRDVTNYGVWKIFGQVDPIAGSDAFSDVAFVLAILFVAIANVLLLNVLVALFNVTIHNVENQSHRIWRYQRFLIVFEYSEKPPLPPPFNSLYYLFSGIRYVYRKIRSCCERNRHVGNEVFFMDSSDGDENNLPDEFKITDAMQRESAIADDYWRDTLKHGRKNQVEGALANIERKLQDLKERIQSNNQVVNFDQQCWMSDV